jgi:hypothetical protein
MHVKLTQSELLMLIAAVETSMIGIQVDKTHSSSQSRQAEASAYLEEMIALHNKLLTYQK